MRLPRMTTRRWTIAVAVVALLIVIVPEVIRELRLARRYQGRADAWGHCLVLCDGRRGNHQRSAVYYAMMKRKYERAANHPWLPVEPDPPGPE